MVTTGSGMPTSSSQPRNSYDWKRIVLALRREAHVWKLDTELVDVPVRLVTRVRLKQHPALRLVDGFIEADPTNIYTTPEGQQRCDVWLRFNPYPTRVDTEPPTGGTREET